MKINNIENPFIKPMVEGFCIDNPDKQIATIDDYITYLTDFIKPIGNTSTKHKNDVIKKVDEVIDSFEIMRDVYLKVRENLTNSL